MNSRLRWVAKHGVARALIRHQARRGCLEAELLVDDRVLANPYPHFARFRDRGALDRGPLGWSTAQHATCAELLRRGDFGVGAEAEMPAPVRVALSLASRGGPPSPFEPPSMLRTNPPDHTRFRKPVTRAFSPRAIKKLSEGCHRVVEELLDDMAGESHVDLVQRFAGLLPVTMIAEVLGVPASMRQRFLDWGDRIAAASDPGQTYREFCVAETAQRELAEWMLGHFQRLRRNPGEDILSQLVTGATSDDAAETLTEHELLVIAMLLLGAGFETTVNLLSSGIRLLVEHPDQLALLREDPQRWPTAVDEILRYEPPVQFTGRIAMHDTEVAGAQLPQGSAVLVLLAGANRDPAVFEDPDRFDVLRPNAREHLSFSGGIHYCLGTSLARMQGEIGLRRLFERYPDLTLAGTPMLRHTRMLRGPAALPVALHGAPIRMT